MRRILKIQYFVILSALLLAWNLPSTAAERMDSLSLKIYFHQDSTNLDLEYRDNIIHMEQFVRDVKKIMAEPAFRLQDIYIRSSASPEGPFDHNIWLSQERGKVLKDYLQKELQLSDDKFDIDAIGEDWVGLRDRVVANKNVPNRKKILEILDSHSSYVYGRPKSVLGGPKKELMDLNGGRTWFWLLDNIYPDLRSAGNTIVCHYIRLREPEPAPPVVVPAPVIMPAPIVLSQPGRIIDTVVVIQRYIPEGAPAANTVSKADAYPVPMFVPFVPLGGEPVAEQPKKAKRERTGPRYRFGIRTNLLFDAILSPNIGIEFPIGKKFSVQANHNFPWYVWDEDRYAYELVNTNIEGRFWFGNREKYSVLTGGYIGLYAAGTRGDLEYQSKGFQVPNAWQIGLTGGWSLPLGKNDNWRLDLGLGVGYMPIKYDYYERSESTGLLMYKYSGVKNWIGPTNIRCSLVWMIPMNKKAKAAKEEKQTTSNTTDAK